MDGRCCTCRWWSPADPGSGWGACDLTLLDAEGWPIDADPGAPAIRRAVVMATGAGEARWLDTEAGFGCTQHAPDGARS